MHKFYLLILITVTSLTAYSQGSIAGNIKDSKTGEAVIGANVVIQGTTQGAATDIEGNFVINNVKEGTYTLQISSVTYKPHTIPFIFKYLLRTNNSTVAYSGIWRKDMRLF